MPFAPTVKPLAHVAHAPRHVAPVARLDNKFVRGVATVAACIALLGSPHAALAKGGGYGGSHSSYHSSSSHSSSSHSSASRSSRSSSSPSRSTSSRSTSSIPRSYSPSTRSISRSSRRSSRSRTANPFPEEEVHVEYSPPPPPRRTSRRYVYSQPRPSSTVYYDTAIDAPPTAVVRSEKDDAFLEGLWTGRVEAATIVGLIAATYSGRSGERDEDERAVWSNELDEDERAVWSNE